jgi:hypothetical protein
MADPSPSTAVPATGHPDDLSIVLFGMPAAGKSSLLGALAQAAQAQEHLLNGRLTDLSHGLDELRRRVYEESPRRTAEEVVPYPVDFAPFHQDNRPTDAEEHVGAVVIDCDGRVANDLLVRRRALNENSPEGTLAHEVLEADTLVLVLDAAAPPAQVEADFAEFDRFLRQLESSRSERTEVGGLPVFLVLTKCDLLAKPNDGAADWMERIEQRKRDVDARFRKFLARREQEAGPLPFGRINLHLWATAVKRPALAGLPPKAREPYGVAELFRQCLEEAAAFRARRRQSGRRLFWTVGGAAGMVALMIVLAVVFALKNLNTQGNDLLIRAEIVRGSDASLAADRLRGSVADLRRREADLAQLQSDPQFSSLPSDLQQLIRDRHAELRSYLQYLDRLRQSPRAQDVHTERALREVIESLQTVLALPQPEWQLTEAGRLHDERLQEVKARLSAVKQANNWFLDNSETADALWTFKGYQSGPESAGIDWQAWASKAEAQLGSQRRPPSAGDPTLERFEEVWRARSDWEASQRRLKQLLDLTTALGLAPAAPGRPAVLVIPRQFTLEQARLRRRELEQAYPNYQTDFVLERAPEAIRPKVRQVAETNYQYLLEPGQDAVLHQLQQAGGGSDETASRWEAVRTWLRSPEDLSDWRVLATVLARLHDPEAGDPVNALASFLARTSFPIDIQRLTLEIPESLGVKPGADATLLVYHPASAGEKPVLVFESSGGGERDAQRRVWIYRFRSVERQRFTYRPGDRLWATLPLRDDLMFTWARDRSSMYQFERLLRPPRLHKASEPNTTGTLEPKVQLTITPADGVPRPPDLMPVVRLEKNP